MTLLLYEDIGAVFQLASAPYKSQLLNDIIKRDCLPVRRERPFLEIVQQRGEPLF